MALPLENYDQAVASVVAEGLSKLTVQVYACPKHVSAESAEPGSCPMADCAEKLVETAKPVAKKAIANEKTRTVELTLAMDRVLKLSEIRKVAESNVGKVYDDYLKLTGRTIVIVEPEADAPCPMTLYPGLAKMDGMKEVGTAAVSEDKKTIRILVKPIPGKEVSLADVRRVFANNKLKPVDVEWGRAAQDAEVVECPECRK